MLSRLFGHVPVSFWSESSVVVFTLVFFVILYRVLQPARKEYYEQAGSLPFGDKDEQ